MKRFLLASLLMGLISLGAWGQVSVTNGTPSFSIDFTNTTPTTAGSNPSTAFAGAGFEPNTTTAGTLNSNAWATTGFDQGTLNFGGAYTSGDHARGITAVAITTGGIYAYTGSPGSAADPTLMIQPSNPDFTPGTLTLRIQNNGTTNITSFNISYNLYVRNDEGRSSSFNFSYSSDDITYSPVVAMDYTSPVVSDALGWVLVGTAPSRSGTLSALAIAPGAYFYIRWSSDDVAGTTGRDELGLDDINVTANFGAPNTITTGTVSTPPFVLANCTATATGSVSFTSTDVFAGGNIFTAQLSDDVGSFGSPTIIGTIPGSGPDPVGNISITIPAGTVGGTGYRIRVISSSPSTTGSSSAAFTITQQGVGGCASANTDYFRSAQSGNWAAGSTWESSPDNTNWISATRTPTYLANDISIRANHTVTISSNVTVDEVLIEFDGILEHTGGTLTIEDNPVSDLIVGSGGIFVLSSVANPPQFGSGSPTVEISTTGILRVSTTGLTSAAPLNGVNVSNYDYKHASILEYTPVAAFSTSDVTYFPNVNATTIPIFRTLNSAAITVGAGFGNNTIINGVFECNGSDVNWQFAGDKTFRNGIRGLGNVIALASSGKFIINGVTADLGGAGSLVLPTAGLEIGTPTTVTMISDKTITGNFSLLIDTYVELGNFNLTVSGTITNASITSYVKTNGTGKLTLNNVASGAGGKLFPIGRSSINPLFISSTTPADYSARIVEPITPAIFNLSEAVLRTWYIASSVTAPGATISFGYTFPTDCGVSYNNAGPVEVGVNVSSVWNIHQTGLTPASFVYPMTYTVTPPNPINYFNGLATEFPFVVANNGAVLPIDCIIYTSAQKRNNTGIIRWTVNSCVEVSSFEVQRSVGNVGFQTLGIIHPPVNETNFNFTDPSLAKGTNLYRIKVNGINGSAKYSNTVALVYDSDELLISSVAPNPVHDIAKLTLSAAKPGFAEFKVYSLSGSLVKQWHSGFAEGNTTIEMNVTVLPAGIYQVLVTTANSRTVTRFVKQ